MSFCGNHDNSLTLSLTETLEVPVRLKKQKHSNGFVPKKNNDYFILQEVNREVERVKKITFPSKQS